MLSGSEEHGALDADGVVVVPDGSGVIEGGYRAIVADRLKKCGSRWSVDGANGVMAIRCLAMNGQTTDFFDWRKAA